MQKTVLNLLTGRWINPNGKLFQKLIREGFIYTNKLSDYIDYIWGDISIFSHPALIPPLSILVQNLVQLDRFNLIILLKLCWRHKETKAWRNGVLMKFLHQLNLTPSKYRPGALYDAFTETDVLGPEHILALTRLLD